MASWHKGLDWKDVYMYIHLCVCAREGLVGENSKSLHLLILIHIFKFYLYKATHTRPHKSRLDEDFFFLSNTYKQILSFWRLHQFF